MLHHCNIDRVWALYQDYHDQDAVPSELITENCYSAGRGIDLDDPLPFESGAGPHSSFFLRDDGNAPTPRDAHHSYGDLLKVTYANDFLGRLLSIISPTYVASNNESWMELAPGPVDSISCSVRRLQESASTSNLTASEASEILGISNDVPPWSNVTTRLIWENLTAEGLSPRDALNTLAYRECVAEGNQLLASPSWIARQKMQGSRDLFKCFNRGNPKDCVPQVDIVSNDDSFNFEYNPIKIISFDDSSVKFSVSQVWMPASVDKVALHYMNVDESERCDLSENVFPGEFGEFEAQCTDGVAAVKLYATDKTFSTSAPGGSVTQMCGAAGIPSSKTHVHSITLPCRLDALQCPPPLAFDPVCDGTTDFAIATDIFDTPKDVDSWIFSSIGKRRDLGTYLEPALGTSKTFRVPASASNLTVTMEIFALNCPMQSNVSILVADRFVELGTFDCSPHKPKSFTSDDVYVEILGESASAEKVALIIPPQYYSATGRLLIGMRNEFIGIGSLTMTADCSDSVPVWLEPEVVSVIEQVVVP
jgi:hypothetical protein